MSIAGSYSLADQFARTTGKAEETLTTELAAYTHQRNDAKATVRWQFDVQQARTKIGRFYPQLS